MTPVSRRSFLQAATLGAASLGRFPLAARARQGAQAAPVPSAAAAGRTLKLGLIGCGWYGLVDVEAAFKAGGVEVLGVCDVDTEHLAQAADAIGKMQAARPRTFKHHRDLIALPGLDAVRTRRPPGCPVEEGLKSTTAVKLAMIAYDTGRRVTWDAAREQVVGDPDAARHLKRDYRAPWEHPYRG